MDFWLLCYDKLMIGQIKGKISFTGDKFIIIDTGGVGYKVAVTPDTLLTLHEGTNCTLWTKLVVKEDALDLYGFMSKKELDFFELLISISGIGPKGALGILSLAPVETLTKAISAGDSSYLTRVSGIGRKIAEKVVLELRDKLGAIEGEHETLGQEADALEALVALGYSMKEAREALKAVPESVIETSARVKEALKKL